MAAAAITPESFESAFMCFNFPADILKSCLLKTSNYGMERAGNRSERAARHAESELLTARDFRTSFRRAAAPETPPGSAPALAHPEAPSGRSRSTVRFHRMSGDSRHW